MIGRVFTARLPIDTPIPVIIDEVGITYIDDEYRRNGEDAGWLILVGWHRGPNDELIYRYRLRD